MTRTDASPRPDTRERIRRAREAVALDAHEPFGVLAVVGPDARAFLQTQLPLDVLALAADGVAPTALLDARGRVRHVLLAVGAGTDVLLVARRERIDALRAALDRFHIREDLRLEDRRDDLAVLEIHGPRTGELLAAVSAVRVDVGGAVAADLGDGVRFVPRAWTGAPGGHLLAPRTGLDDLLPRLTDATTRLDGAALAAGDFEILRVAGDLPDEERDLGEKTLLHELDRAEAWSSFTKGCYLGQETVARVHSRGRTHRTLRALLVETQTVPAPAALVLRDGDPVGEVTSAAPGAEAGHVVALAWLRREHAAPDTVVHVAGDGGHAVARVVERPAHRAPGPAEEAARMHREGLALFNADRFPEAVARFEKALFLDPHRTDAYEAIGVCHERMGDLDEAVRVMGELTELAPDDPMPWTNLSRYLARQGRIEEAEQAKGKALHLSWKREAGEREATRRLEAERAERARALEERVGLFEQVLALDPDDVVALFGLGKVYLDLGRFAEAVPLFEKAVERKPDYSTAYQHLGTALVAVGRAEDAREVLRRGIAQADARGDLMPRDAMRRRLRDLEDAP